MQGNVDKVANPSRSQARGDREMCRGVLSTAGPPIDCPGLTVSLGIGWPWPWPVTSHSLHRTPCGQWSLGT